MFAANEEFADPADSSAASYQLHPVDEIEPTPEETDLESVGRSLAKILVWCAESKSIVGLGQRLWVFLYVVRPDLIEGQTLDQFGALDNKTRQAVDKVVQEFQDNFNTKGRNMRSTETRLACQKSHLIQNA